jgi:coenzyme F420-reducing hydrogenase alpha subunit
MVFQQVKKIIGGLTGKKSPKKITIEPITRIEGHAKVTIHLNKDNMVDKTYFHVTEFRGFEKLLEGRHISEAPRIVTSICGICPVSHHLASAKATDAVFGVELSETAKLIRELMHMGQYIHSHALHFFFLAAPDILFPKDAPKRNVLGVAKAHPDIAKKAITLRSIGQDIIARTGGKAIHPVTAVPGGVTKNITKEERDAMLKDAKEALDLALFSAEFGKKCLEEKIDLIQKFAKFDSFYMGLVKGRGFLELYDGVIRVVDKTGSIIDEFNPNKYLDYIGEYVEDWSYLKFPYLKKVGYPEGLYRVNTLARINVAEEISTPKANELLKEFREKFGRPAHQTLLYHYARLIELVYAAERTLEILNDDSLLGSQLRIPLENIAGEGIGVVEAPRGTLIHHYKTKEDGRIERANIIVSTAHNNLAINKSVNLVARDFIKGPEVDEPTLNTIEMAIRAYDPCFSCATHTLNGRLPLEVETYKGGRLIFSRRNY